MMLLILCGCKASVNEKSESFTYKYSVNNCTTDEKTFSSNEAMCDALRNDSLNHYCAQDLRYQRFQTDCPGRTWNP